MHKSHQLNQLLKKQLGFTLIEVIVGAIIMGTAIMAIYGAVLWGRYRATQSQYIVTASNIGRHQLEIIKSLGFTNAISTTYVKYDIASTLFNPTLGYGGIFGRTNEFSLDTAFDLESSYVDDNSYGAGRTLRIFTVNVYLHSAPADTATAPFNTPLVSYVTYLTSGGI
jgi:prepilin-type N-terminal cleavage/methylation domain-containing protein